MYSFTVLCNDINWTLKTASKFCMMFVGMHVHIYNESIFIHLENHVESLSVNYTYHIDIPKFDFCTFLHLHRKWCKCPFHVYTWFMSRSVQSKGPESRRETHGKV